MQRDYCIDVVAGLMIITMVLTHTYDERMQIDILNFFMPWFFLKSGMYFKRDSIGKTVADAGRKLLYPFVTFTILGYIVNTIKKALEGDTNWVHYILTPFKELLFTGAIEGNLPLWFLLTLFFVRIIYMLMYRENIDKRVLGVVFVVLGIFVVNKINGYTYFPQYITNSLTGLFFYACGNIIRNTYKNTLVWIISLAVFISVYVLDNPTMIMGSNKLQSGHYILWFLFSLARCVMINGLFDRLRWKFPVLHWIGVNSMIIYVSHYVVINVFDILTKYVVNIELSTDKRLFLLISTLVISEFFIVRLVKKTSLHKLIKLNHTKNETSNLSIISSSVSSVPGE